MKTSGKRIRHCRICGSEQLLDILDLGIMKFTGVFKTFEEQHTVPAGPLVLTRCEDCKLVQLAHIFDDQALFGETYGYRSGLNKSMIRHLEGIAAITAEAMNLNEDSVVIDIGANDGTLLHALPRCQRVGVDPLIPYTGFEESDTVRAVPHFFDPNLVYEATGRKLADVIFTIAMFYDLHNPVEFAKRIARLLKPTGVWIVEVAYLPSIIEQVAFDGICHEHAVYYDFKHLLHVATAAGLYIRDVSLNDTNGGSIRCVFGKDEPHREASYNLALEQLEAESFLQASAHEVFSKFAAEVIWARQHLRDYLDRMRCANKTVLGYGASTKGNVLLQYAGINPHLLPAIVEVNADKFGKVTPGSEIAIISEAQAAEIEPDAYVVFPWHFRDGIIAREKEFLDNGGELIFPLPKFERYSRGL